MSHPPSLPNSPPPAFRDDPRIPARRAGVMLMVLGSALILFGALFIAALFGLPLEEFEKAMKMGGQPAGLEPEVFRIAMTILLSLVALVGLLLLVFGIFVRGGRMVWVVLSLVICIMVELFLVVQLLSVVLAPAPGNLKAMGFLLLIVPAAMFGLAIQWLIAAARNASRLPQAGAPLAPQPGYPQQTGYNPPGYSQHMQGYHLPPPPAQSQQPSPQDENLRQ